MTTETATAAQLLAQAEALLAQATRLLHAAGDADALHLLRPVTESLSDAIAQVTPEDDADETIHAYTPVTEDVAGWLAVNFPEGDVAIRHDDTCDMSAAGDECEGGCPVVSIR